MKLTAAMTVIVQCLCRKAFASARLAQHENRNRQRRDVCQEPSNLFDRRSAAQDLRPKPTSTLYT